MDEFYEQEHQAWLDERNAVISFHEIPQSEYFRAPDGVFWVYILSLLERGYRVRHLSRVNAQKSKNIFYEARMRAISSRKSCSEHR